MLAIALDLHRILQVHLHGISQPKYPPFLHLGYRIGSECYERDAIQEIKWSI